MSMMDKSSSQTTFLCLPPELRLAVYEELLLRPLEKQGIAGFLPVPANYYDYEAACDTKTDPFTLSIRAEDPATYNLIERKHLRTPFHVHAGNLRTQCILTAYFLFGRGGGGLHTGILAANAKIHSEAAKVLYSNYTFDFDTHVEAMVAFLDDLTPLARGCVRSVRVVKRALPYDKEFDRAEWSTAMRYLARLPGLKSLSLGVVAGKPGPDGWDMVPRFRAEHFDLLTGMESMGWIGELLAIKGLESLEVDAVVEHCPPPRSEGMARYIQFSASVEGAFSEYIRGQMLA